MHIFLVSLLLETKAHLFALSVVHFLVSFVFAVRNCVINTRQMNGKQMTGDLYAQSLFILLENDLLQ